MTDNKILLMNNKYANKDVLWERGCDKEEAKLRLKTRFSEWLKMENICVLAGAGTSRKYGGLTLKEFAEKLTLVLKSYYRLKKQTENLKQLSLISNVLEEKPENIEQWMSYLKGLTYLSESNFLGGATIKIKDFEVDVSIIKSIVKDIEKFVFLLSTLKLDQEKDTDEVKGHHSFIAKLISRDSSLGRVKLFTLNYDTLFEQALDDLGILYADGFIGSVNRKFNSSCYELDYYYPGKVSEGRVRRYDKFMHLYKLHGSINWREPAKLGEAVENIPVDLGKIDLIREKIISISGDNYDLDEETIRSIEKLLSERGTLGILPTSNKYIETIQMPYAHMFRALQESLQNPQTFLLIVGYGFGDEHINRIIEDALTNPSLIVCIVDPFSLNEKNEIRDENEKLKKYLSLEMGGRVFLLTEQNPDYLNPETGFEKFSKNLMPDVRMLDQWIKLKQLENKLKGSLTEEELSKRGENNEK
jgi:hypothetical protein